MSVWMFTSVVVNAPARPLTSMHTTAKGQKNNMHSWVVRLEDLFVKSMKDQKSLCHAIQVSSLCCCRL